MILVLVSNIAIITFIQNISSLQGFKSCTLICQRYILSFSLIFRGEMGKVPFTCFQQAMARCGEITVGQMPTATVSLWWQLPAPLGAEEPPTTVSAALRYLPLPTLAEERMEREWSVLKHHLWQNPCITSIMSLSP